MSRYKGPDLVEATAMAAVAADAAEVRDIMERQGEAVIPRWLIPRRVREFVPLWFCRFLYRLVLSGRSERGKQLVFDVAEANILGMLSFALYACPDRLKWAGRPLVSFVCLGFNMLIFFPRLCAKVLPKLWELVLHVSGCLFVYARANPLPVGSRNYQDDPQPPPPPLEDPQTPPGNPQSLLWSPQPPRQNPQPPLGKPQPHLWSPQPPRVNPQQSPENQLPSDDWEEPPLGPPSPPTALPDPLFNVYELAAFQNFFTTIDRSAVDLDSLTGQIAGISGGTLPQGNGQNGHNGLHGPPGPPSGSGPASPDHDFVASTAEEIPDVPAWPPAQVRSEPPSPDHDSVASTAQEIPDVPATPLPPPVHKRVSILQAQEALATARARAAEVPAPNLKYPRLLPTNRPTVREKVDKVSRWLGETPSSSVSDAPPVTPSVRLPPHPLPANPAPVSGDLQTSPVPTEQKSLGARPSASAASYSVVRASGVPDERKPPRLATFTLYRPPRPSPLGSSPPAPPQPGFAELAERPSQLVLLPPASPVTQSFQGSADSSRGKGKASDSVIIEGFPPQLQRQRPWDMPAFGFEEEDEDSGGPSTSLDTARTKRKNVVADDDEDFGPRGPAAFFKFDLAADEEAKGSGGPSTSLDTARMKRKNVVADDIADFRLDERPNKTRRVSSNRRRISVDGSDSKDAGNPAPTTYENLCVRMVTAFEKLVDVIYEGSQSRVDKGKRQEKAEDDNEESDYTWRL
ncbi:hypothetical protein B0H66DRAFT_637473 [Apodospora peruviana]|uniref:Uncharacterized protein n=1 Tax=Apodospora peruviana TaxID=516989 RepID=A0AAE0MC11_9PEZI|nr:hypothetical protein B0H66DRAFT_637473 [Apodospora peruviana]